MSDHLPECDTQHNGLLPCICEPLRACEQRVREDEQFKCLTKSENRSRWREEGVNAGYSAGLRAARKAVAASADHYELCICDECCGTAAALAAIDALKEKS